MPPPKSVTRDQVIEAAFALVRAKGLSALSARNMAKRLRTSTSPIYGYFRKMDLLRREVVIRALELLHNYQTKKRSGEPFFDMGLGYIEFARKEKRLFFEVLASDLHKLLPDNVQVGSDPLELMRSDPSLAGLSDAALGDLLMKMWIFVHGLASLIGNEKLGALCDREIAAMLREVGEAVIGEAVRLAKQPGQNNRSERKYHNEHSCAKTGHLPPSAAASR
jgi:AcrR family transcriptional regulator